MKNSFSFSNILFFLIIFVLINELFASSEVDSPLLTEYPQVFLETLSLESKTKNHDFSAAEKNRLAEIYFLTSRCADLKKLKIKSDLLCACGGPCINKNDLSAVEFFKRLCESKVRSKDLTKKIKAQWEKIKHYPEAQHILLKAILKRNITDSYLVSQRFELERSLAGYEVLQQ